MESAFTAAMAALIFITGSCIFSFLNVVIYRVPRNMDFVKGRSICPSCNHELGALDLIPVVSYVVLGGKCRYCGTKIGARDTFVELFGGGTALLCAAFYKEELPAALTVFAFFCILTVVALIDIDTMEIPDGTWIGIFILAGISLFTMPGQTLVSRLIGLFCVSGPMLLLAVVIPGAFGGGDIRLMAACGAFLGWKLTLVSAALAILAGGGWGIYLLAAKQKTRKEHFAFGPFLCMGMAVSLLWGERLIEWYLGFFFT